MTPEDLARLASIRERQQDAEFKAFGEWATHYSVDVAFLLARCSPPPAAPAPQGGATALDSREEELDIAARLAVLQADEIARRGKAVQSLRGALYLILTASDMENGNPNPHVFIPKVVSLLGAKCPESACEHSICAALREAERVFDETRGLLRAPASAVSAALWAANGRRAGA